MNSVQDAFYGLTDALSRDLAGGEELFLRFRGEDSDFVRVSRARVRQAGHVVQRSLTLTLVRGARQATGGLDLAGDLTADLVAARDVLAALRQQLPLLPEDPWLNWQRGDARHERIDPDLLPAAPVAVAEALTAAAGLDLVGLWASGGIHVGFASSHGQRAWHTVHTCAFDWSCHRPDGQAVKGCQAGTTWDAAAWRAGLATARSDLARFDRPRRRLAPGAWRAYLAPAAVGDLIGMLAWGGFSCRARRTRTSPLLRLETGVARLSPAVSMAEDAAGLAPAFTAHGFARPPRVILIERGALGEALVGARSAREYGLPANADNEAPVSLDMAGGDLARADVLRQLGTGVWIGNLHYLNYSDRSACRITGMTRFACWWVEDGEVVAPIEHMRFDDDLYGLFGDRLVDLTRERELLLDTGTYSGRSLAGCTVPGALVSGLRFTL